MRPLMGLFINLVQDARQSSIVEKAYRTMHWKEPGGHRSTFFEVTCWSIHTQPPVYQVMMGTLTPIQICFNKSKNLRACSPRKEDEMGPVWCGGSPLTSISCIPAMPDI